MHSFSRKVVGMDFQSMGMCTSCLQYSLETGEQQKKWLCGGSWTDWVTTSNETVLLFNGKHCLCCFVPLL